MTNIALAEIRDIDGWMDLVEQVRDSFPGLETREALEEHRKTVLDFMSRDAAICAKREGRVVGARRLRGADDPLPARRDGSVPEAPPLNALFMVQALEK